MKLIRGQVVYCKTLGDYCKIVRVSRDGSVRLRHGSGVCRHVQKEIRLQTNREKNGRE
jgi:hypothetical protein